MAIVVEQTFTGTNSGATSVSCTISGTTSNNLLVAHLRVEEGVNSGTFTHPSGWTELTGSVYDQGGGNGVDSGATFWKISDGAETSVAWSWSDTGKAVICVIEVSGLAASSPLEDESTAVEATATSIGTGTATPVTADGLAVALLGTSAAWGNADLADVTIDSSFTKDVIQKTSGGGAAGNALSAIGTLVYSSTAGQSATWTGDGTSSWSRAQMAAFKAAAGGGGTRPQGPLGHPLIGAFGGPI